MSAPNLNALMEEWGNRRNADEAYNLYAAARELDELWQSDAERGKRDSLGSVEYQRLSAAPRLRFLADLIDPLESGAAAAS